MGCPGDIDLHFWLTRSVGRSMGLSFAAAIRDGRLSTDDYLALVQTCRGCGQVGPCQRWLGCQKGADARTCAPEFCPNARALDALKRPEGRAPGAPAVPR